jgi:ubiquinone/menaquinone biosynthesis C-methylase UbiE
MGKILHDHIEHYRIDGQSFDYFSVENRTIREEERRRIELLASQMKLTSGQSLIDCGSGGGWVSQAFLPKGVFVCAIDLSAVNLKGVRERFDKSGSGGYIVADLTHLPFKRQTFDGATSNDVYEHLEELNDVTGELLRVMKSGASAFVSVPYRENIVYYLCIHCNKLTPINAHLHSFDENSLGDIFIHNGFKIKSIKKFMNKGLALLQIYYLFCRWMPFWMWRVLDIMANFVIRKPGRMAMIFVANER